MPTTLIQATEVVNGGIVRPAPMSARFDPLLLSPHIKDAETRHIVPVIGQDLYDALIAEKGTTVSNYNADAGPLQDAFTVTAVFETLWVEHLLSFCSYAVLYEALPFVGLQISSQGIQINDTEFSRSGGVQAVKFMQDTILQRLDLKSAEIKDYLCDNKTLYTDFDSSVCTCDTTLTKQNRHGIIFY